MEPQFDEWLLFELMRNRDEGWIKLPTVVESLAPRKCN